MRASVHEVGIPVYLPLDIPGGSAEIKMPKRLTEAEFYQFCADNPDLRIEQDKNGKITLTSLSDFDSGIFEGHILGLLYAWWIATQKGLTLSPTAGFKLPDGSTRSADGAWVSDEKNRRARACRAEKICPRRARFRHRSALHVRPIGPAETQNVRCLD
ncbi:MAG: Uma2 family endonuclease [Saprospiraceae bacterium]